MITYLIATIDGREFDNDYSYASVIDAFHQDGEYHICTQVDEINAPRYESALSSDGAVLRWYRVADELERLTGNE